MWFIKVNYCNIRIVFLNVFGFENILNFYVLKKRVNLDIRCNYWERDNVYMKSVILKILN